MSLYQEQLGNCITLLDCQIGNVIQVHIVDLVVKKYTRF